MKREISIVVVIKNRTDFVVKFRNNKKRLTLFKNNLTWLFRLIRPNEKWQFLRSTVENTKLQAKQFMTNFKPNEDGTDFYHSSYVALIDRNQLIRGFYNILIPEEVIRLKKDIKILLN